MWRSFKEFEILAENKSEMYKTFDWLFTCVDQLFIKTNTGISHIDC